MGFLMIAMPALVVFDLFGTLVRFGVRNHPFRKVMVWAREQGRKPQSDDARVIMTTNKDCGELLANLGVFPSNDMLVQLDREIRDELNSLELFDDVLPTFRALDDRGVRIAICSNLAKPYSAAIDNLLPKNIDFLRCLSFEVGAIKPEKEIYDCIVNRSGVMPEQVLFIGDTRSADFDGPLAYGFRALHLVRGQIPGVDAISSLMELCVNP